MKTILTTAPSFGIDTVAAISTIQAQTLKTLGYSFAIRYLGGLTSEELNKILSAGLGVMPVTYSRNVGWIPSAALGISDGKTCVTRMKALSLTDNVTVWLDLEGCAGPAAQTIAWINAWASEIIAAKYQPGLYVGAQPGGLNSLELWKLKVVRYWRSCSNVPEPTTCGWCMQQLKPPNVLAGTLQVDVNALEKDYLGRVPSMVVA